MARDNNVRRLNLYWLRRAANFVGFNFPTEETKIDLNKVQVVGFEPSRSFSKVESMVLGLERGGSLPVVDVVRVSDSSYELVYGASSHQSYVDSDCFCPFRDLYGGHHRTLAYWFANIPMSVRIFPRHRMKVPERIKLDILDSRFSEDYIGENVEHIHGHSK